MTDREFIVLWENQKQKAIKNKGKKVKVISQVYFYAKESILYLIQKGSKYWFLKKIDIETGWHLTAQPLDFYSLKDAIHYIVNNEYV